MGGGSHILTDESPSEDDSVIPGADPGSIEDPTTPDEDNIIPDDPSVIPGADPGSTEDPTTPDEDPVIPDEDPVTSDDPSVIPDDPSVIPGADPESTPVGESDEITLLGAGDDIDGLSLEAPGAYQTFFNEANGTVPPLLNITINVDISYSYVSGGRIELLLDYSPAGQNLTDFDTAGAGAGTVYGSLAAMPDFFTVKTLPTANATAADIIDHIDMTTTPGTMIIYLKDRATQPAATGRWSLPLVLEFNDDYLGKIPQDTILWKPQPTAYVNSDLARTATAREIKTSAVSEIVLSPVKNTPDGTAYVDGVMSLSLRWDRAAGAYNAGMDSAYANTFWVEVPDGTTVTGNSVFLAFFTNAPVVNYMGSGYTRYSQSAADNAATFNRWNWNGIPASNYAWQGFYPTPPSTLQENDPFRFRMGADYKIYNAAEQHVTYDMDYIKSNRLGWDLRFTTSLASSGIPIVCRTTDDTAGKGFAGTMSPYGGDGTVYLDSIRNEGSGSITGVSMVLYQASPASAKLNFNTVTLVALRDLTVAGVYPTWSQYKIVYDIATISGGVTTISQVAGETVIPNHATRGYVDTSLSLPGLSSGQYIDKITAIPMGVSGTEAGVLPPQNGFRLNYTARSWNGQVWPDGTPINHFGKVDMSWKLNYHDDPALHAGDATFSKTEQGGSNTATYLDGTDATVMFISSQAAAGVDAGDTVDYEIQAWIMDRQSTMPWDEPKIAIRVPKLMTVDSVGDLLINNAAGVATGGTSSVTWKLENNDANYNYYSFTAENYSQIETLNHGGTPVFTIPVTFKVDETMAAGDYTLPRVLVSSKNSADFYHYSGVNNLGGENAAVGVNYGITGNYYRYPSASATTLKVKATPRLEAGSAVASIGTAGLYVTSSLSPAQHGETTHMKLTLTNGGNVSFNNIRLYDILPYSGDANGSSGSVAFAGLSGAPGATVRYTTAAVGGLPVYGAHGTAVSGAAGADDLQVSTFQSGWSTGTVPNNATAIFLDFGNTALAPGQTIEVILNFDIPATGDQTAYNQFRYSAKEVNGSPTPLNQTSLPQGFSTETKAIIYHDGDLPLTYHLNDIAGIPAANSASYISGTETLNVSADTPTLTGYTFEGWADSQVRATAGTVDYAQSAVVTFTAAGTVNLYPVWTLRTDINVTFNKNTMDTGAADAEPGSKTVTFGGAVGNVPDGTTAVTDLKPVRPGYDFVGWSVDPNATKANYEADASGYNVTDVTEVKAELYAKISAAQSAVTAGSDFTVYAVWAAKSNITLTFHKNTTDTGSADAQPGSKLVTYGSAVGDVPDGTTAGTDLKPVRPGYDFVGWSVNAAADKADYDADVSGYNVTAGTVVDAALYGKISAAQSAVAAGENFTVYAVWAVKSDIVLTFHKNTTDAGSADAQPGSKLVTFGSAVGDVPDGTTAGTDLKPVRLGYDFVGWSVNPAATKAEYVVDVSGYNVTDGTVVDAALYGKISAAQSAVTAGSNFTVYAVWAAKTNITLTFDKNTTDTGAAEAQPGSKLVTYGSAVGDVPDGTTAGDQKPVRPGYDFVGWSVDANATKTNYDGDASGYNVTDITVVNAALYSKISAAQSAVTAGDNFTVYAVWAAKTNITLTFDKNTTDTGAVGAQPGSKQVTYGDAVGDVPDGTTAGDQKPVRAGYNFIGWSVDANATKANYDINMSGYNLTDVTVVDAALYGKINAAQSAGLTAGDNFTVYAVWQMNPQYTVRYAAGSDGVSGLPGSASVTAGTSYTVSSAAPTKLGHTFNGWTASFGGTYKGGNTFVMPGADVTLTAQWTANYYSVAYAAGGTGVSGLPGSASVLADTTYTVAKGTPARLGYTFDGWTASFGGTYKGGSTFKMPFENVTLTARWTANDYTVTYAAGGDNVSGLPGGAKLHAGERYKVSAVAPTKTGHTFDGWSASIGGAYSSGASFTMPAANVVLTAKWTANYFTVNYAAGAERVSGLPGSDIVLAETTYAVSAAVPTKLGYTFDGWTSSGGGTYFGGSTFKMPFANVTLTAKWIANNYTVTYAAGGDGVSGLPGGATVRTDARYTVSSAVPERADFTFDGWTASFGGIYTGGSSFTMPASNVVLTARWIEDDAYTVIYQGNGNTGGSAPVDTGGNAPSGSNAYRAGTTVSVIDNTGALTQAGYKFTGWNTGADGSGTNYTAGNTFVITANTVLYAQYEKVLDPPTVTEIDPLVPEDGAGPGGASTGNFFTDLVNGNVPRGSFTAGGTWSLISLLFALVAVIMAALLIAGAAVRRRRDAAAVAGVLGAADAAAVSEREKKGRIWRTLTIVVGVLTAVVWLVLEDFSQTMALINQWTLLIGALLLADFVLLGIYRSRRGRTERVDAGAGAGADAADRQTAYAPGQTAKQPI